MTKLDFTNGLDIFDEHEKEYIELKLNKVKLSDDDLKAKFGEIRAQLLLENNEIKRYLVDKALEEAKGKNLVSQFKADQFVKLIPLAISIIAQEMQNGSKSDKIKIAMATLKPVITYLERIGAASAELDSNDKGERAFPLAYKLPFEEND